MAEENRGLKKMDAEMAMQNELLKGALGKSDAANRCQRDEAYPPYTKFKRPLALDCASKFTFPRISCPILGAPYLKIRQKYEKAVADCAAALHPKES